MRSYTLDHLSDATLLADLAALVATERQSIAVLLAHLAEVDARELYKPTPYPSMFAYCTRVLHLAEAVAYKRIRAARVARQFPQILDAIADGRVHVTGIAMLAPHITAENVDELIAAATHRTKHELDVLIARLAPAPDVPDKIRRLPTPRPQPRRSRSSDWIRIQFPRRGTSVSQRRSWCGRRPRARHASSRCRPSGSRCS